jgi:hypothetical protein
MPCSKCGKKRALKKIAERESIPSYALQDVSGNQVRVGIRSPMQLDGKTYYAGSIVQMTNMQAMKLMADGASLWIL